MNRRHFLWAACAGLVCGTVGVGMAMPKPGQVVPDFTLNLLDGGKISLKELRGKPVLLTFWHSGCPHCQREVPVLNQVHEQYKARGLVILSVSVVWDKEQLARMFVEVYKPVFRVGWDASGEIGSLFNIEATPTSVFIGRAGQFADINVGSLELTEYQRRIDALLKMK